MTKCKYNFIHFYWTFRIYIKLSCLIPYFNPIQSPFVETFLTGFFYVQAIPDPAPREASVGLHRVGREEDRGGVEAQQSSEPGGLCRLDPWEL